MRELVAGICAAHGATGHVEYTHEFQPTYNDDDCTAVAIQAAISVVGDDRVDANCAQFMGSEDFGVLARHVPACFMFLGTGETATPLHNSSYDFKDDVLTTGVDYYLAVVRAQLAGRS